MTSYQEDRFGTLLKIDLFNSRNTATLSINPIFATIDNELDDLRAEILANDVLAIRDLSGFTEAKADKRKQLEQKLYLVCNGLRGHFAGLGDKINRKQIDLEKSHIETISEELLNTESELVWKTADPLKALLGPNQVTAADVDALQTLRQDFVGMMKVNRYEEATGKAARENLVTLFEKAFNEVLAKLDELMMPFASTNATLYSEYKTCRAIDDSGGNSGTEGYDVNNFTVPSGGSLIIPIGGGSEPIPPDTQVYFRAVNGSVVICTTELPANPCTDGFQLIQGVTFKDEIGKMGLDLNLKNIQVTNPTGIDVVVRAGVKI